MKKTLRTVLTLAFLALGMTPGATATAAEMAGLQVDIGTGVDAVVRADIEAAVDDTMSSVSAWSWIPARKARAAMNPVVRDCFTGDCLSKAGDATGAEAGMRIRFSGEAQIYDWQIDVYDLRDGSLLETGKGACELCGRSEVVREFQKSLRKTATATRTKPVATKTSKPPVRTPDDTETETKTEPPAETGTETTETTTSTDDATAELVMLEVSVQPPDARITMGGKEIGVGTATVSLEPGTYELQFAREGYQGFKETFVVGPQTSRRAFMRVHLSKTDPDPVAVAPSQGPIDRMGNQRVTYGIISLAVGGALLGTGMWLNAIDGDPACAEGEFTDCPELYDTGTGALITTLGGAALATGGAILLTWDLLAGRTSAQKKARLTPLAAPGGVGVGLTGRF
jgi:hypothetical protein